MPDSSETIRLIELTSARLCQDIGELRRPEHEVLGDGAGGQQGEDVAGAADGETCAPAKPDRDGLSGQASNNQVWRSKLLRAAWGPDERPLSYDELLRLKAGLPAGVKLDPSGLATHSVFPPGVGRIVLNLLLLAADSLPSGGTVMLAGSADDLFLRIAGPAAAWPAGMAACVVDEAAARAAMAGDRGMQMPLTTLLAHASGIRLSFLLASSSQTTPPILRLGGG